MKWIVLLFSIVFASAVLADKPITLSVMTFNIENGGAQVDFNKTVEAIRISGADVVGVQESQKNLARLAEALNWKYYNATQQIISRFPLREAPNAQNRYLLIEVRPGEFVAMANVHLSDEPYGPNLVRDGATVSAILENERKVRLPEILPTLQDLSQLSKNGMPVFLTGDFNSPSNLDWTQITVNVLPNHSKTVPWVVTKTAADLGLKDSFRIIHPDPIRTPGFTWPAGRPFLTDNVDHYNPMNKEPSDRIDFIFYAGNAKVLQSRLIREGGSRHADLKVSPWPSDHAAVVSKFAILR